MTVYDPRKPIAGYASRREAVKALADGTRTSKDIANILGLSADAVRSAARDIKIKLPPVPVFSPWTPEIDASLEVLWTSGIIADTIAARLGNGITRFAVIGRAHRLGLPVHVHSRNRGHTGPKRARTDGYLMHNAPRGKDHGNGGLNAAVIANRLTKRAEARYRHEQGHETGGLLDEPTRPAQRITVAEIMAGQCRYIHGDVGDGAWTFCSQPVVPETSWCEHHYRRTHDYVRRV